MAKNGVVCIGLVVADVLVRAVDLGFQKRDVTVTDEITCAVGGDAMNEACTLARLGVPVQLMSSVGTDLWGDFIIKTGRETRIGMENVKRRSDYPTTISLVLIRHDGERNFICSEGTAMHFMTESLDMESIRSAKVVSLASLYSSREMDAAFLTAARAAKKAGAIVTADTVIMEGFTLESQAELLGLVDFIFPNYDEACIITGETELDRIAGAFLNYGVGNVVIKTGTKGCHVQNRREYFTVPTYKNAKRVDTTGAGDNFAAGFIFGLSRDLSVRECAAYANAAASVSIQYTGAAGAKNLREIEDMMAGGILEV